MSDNTSIEWANAGLPRGASWNPIRARHWEIQNDGGGKERIGWHCTHASEGCRNCYAEGMNKRLGTGLPYKPGHEKDIEIFLDEKTLLQPLKWRDPRGIFVCSMSDAFGPFVTDAMLDRMFAVAALCPQHRFLWLTKRPERMRQYLDNSDRRREISIEEHRSRIGKDHLPIQADRYPALTYSHGEARYQTKSIFEAAPSEYSSMPRIQLLGCIPALPLPNCWMGTSVEDQATADARIPHLLATPAAVRFCSYEPALAPVDFTRINHSGIVVTDALRGTHGNTKDEIVADGQPRLGLVIAGGESGPHARPAHPQWFRDVRDQCTAAGVSYFHKQNGEFVSVSEVAGPGAHHHFSDGATVRRVGKKLAGRLLDRREWNEMPGARS